MLVQTELESKTCYALSGNMKFLLRVALCVEGTKSEYDRGVNTFSPEGRLFQATILSILRRVFKFACSAVTG
eukprot:4822424-Amphidinium_carterae.1